jgi:peptidoglycan LD-endopeptidase CwlK
MRTPHAFNETEDWQGVKLMVVEGYRSTERQDELYKQGRSTPGPIVTRAKGGESPHNYGKAIDVAPTKNGQPDWNTPITPQIAAIGKSQGFEWGGDWKGGFVDTPHFEMTFGQSFNISP